MRDDSGRDPHDAITDTAKLVADGLCSAHFFADLVARDTRILYLMRQFGLSAYVSHI